MKQKLFFFLTLLAFCVGQVWAETATLNSISTKNVVGTKGGSVSTTFNGVTCAVTRNSSKQPGFYTGDGIVRYYADDVMVLSVEDDYVITKIEFTMYSGTVGTANPKGLSSDSKTWEGSAQSVSFTGGGTVKINSIAVTYGAPSTDVLQSITVSGTPDKTEYEEGESFDPTGLTVTGTYSKSGTKTITTGISWTCDPETLNIGTTSVSVVASVGGINSESFTVNGLEVTAHTVKAGEYTIIPNNSFYGTTETYSGNKSTNPTSLTGTKNDITITYSKGSQQYFYVNGSQTRVYNGSTMTFSVPDGFDITKIDFNGNSTWEGTMTSSTGSIVNKVWSGESQNVTITFGGSCTIFSLKVTYGVKRILSSIDVKTEPNLTSYKIGDEFDPTGLCITATYGEDSEDVEYSEANKNEFAFSGFNMDEEGTQTVIVTYREKTANFDITVINVALTSIEVSNPKTQFTEGDDFVFDGIVTAYYDNDTDADVTKAAIFSGYDLSVVGGQTVTVSYTENGQTKYDTYDIVVTRAPKTTQAVFGSEWNSNFGTEYNGSISIKANELTLNAKTKEVTMVVNNGTSLNGYIKTSDFRLYNGYTMTLSVPEGYNIVKIEAGEGGKAINGITADKGTLSIETDGESMTWTGFERTVTFSATATTGFASITVSYTKSHDVTIASSGYSTLYLDYAATVPSGVTAYYATTYDSANDKVVLTEVDGTIAANQGVILKGTAGNTYTFNETTDVTAPTTNLLDGTVTSAGISGLSGTNNDYVLKGGVFEPITSGTLPAYKAYLHVDGRTAGSSSIGIRFEGATGIQNVTINEDNTYYDLLGRKVNNPTPGIYILNGKKTLVR